MIEKFLANPGYRKHWASLVDIDNLRYDAALARALRRRYPQVLQGLLALSPGARLRALAQSGAARPNSFSPDPEERQLAQLHAAYVNPDSGMYRSDYTRTVKAQRPDWFNDLRTQSKKETLLSRALSGQTRPRFTDPDDSSLAIALNGYTCPSNKSYDAELTQRLRSARPDWFNAGPEANKVAILAIAQKGEPRPSRESAIGRALVNYVSANGKSYDPDFTQQLQSLRPEWFNGSRVAANKRELLRLRQAGAEKPRHGTKLGNALIEYSMNYASGYDPAFAAQVLPWERPKDRRIKAVQTPDGVFESATVAGEHYNVTRLAILYRIKHMPGWSYR